MYVFFTKITLEDFTCLSGISFEIEYPLRMSINVKSGYTETEKNLKTQLNQRSIYPYQKSQKQLRP